MEEGQRLCLVSCAWWLYWCKYAGFGSDECKRVPERRALGLAKAVSLETSVASEEGAGVGGDGDGAGCIAEDVNGHGRGSGAEREASPALARRPHEMDNSRLQVGTLCVS